jgi:AmmeMemoRadiSam system protein A
MSSVELAMIVDDSDRRALFDVARRSIHHGLAHQRALLVDGETHSAALQQSRACFVTLRASAALRGCMGCLEANGPLVQGIAHYAYQAAFRDPRFPSLQANELPLLSIGISLLWDFTPIACASEAHLLEQLQPGVDGVILRNGRRSATFLPQVWQQAPEPHVFLSHLKRKAGLPADYWSATLTFQRYRAESFNEE